MYNWKKWNKSPLVRSIRPFVISTFSAQHVKHLRHTPAAWQSTKNPKEFLQEHLHNEDDGIVICTMERPNARNALGKNMMEEMTLAINALRFDPKVRVVILQSAVPKVFCAGADLKERLAMTPEEAAATTYGYRSFFTELEKLPMPTIAVIEGAALGGGLELALSCDFRVASEDAIFGCPETSLAIIPGAGGTQRLPRLIGLSKAKELIFTSRRINAKAAEEIGLVDYVTPPTQAFEKALSLAREIIPNGPVGVRMAKEAIMKGSNMDLDSAMAMERACYAQVIPTKDRIEGLEAFRDKRKPSYTGE